MCGGPGGKPAGGDRKAWTQQVLYSGFFEANQQLRVNGLRWGLDNWVYCANGAHYGGYGTATKIKSALTGNLIPLGSRIRTRRAAATIALVSYPYCPPMPMLELSSTTLGLNPQSFRLIFRISIPELRRR